MKNTVDYRWFSRFSDCEYFPDWALEAEYDSDDFDGWSGIDARDGTEHAISMLKAFKK
jgi:hypothetical protein